MSEVVEGVIDLKCSLAILRKALINVMPEWEEYIVTDPNGKIPMYGYEGKPRNRECHLLIPGGKNPSHKMPPGRRSDNDWGFHKSEDGSWVAIKAGFNLEKALALENTLKAEVARMKAVATAVMMGGRVLSERKEDGKIITTIEIEKNKVTA